jgi:Flp pilus assembly protein TadB
MAEHEETRQDKEARWTAQRAAHDQQQQAYQAARTRRIGRNWLILGAIVLVVAVIAVVVLR